MRRVLANGVFDIFHIGHLRYLREAAKMGDHLVVAVTADEHVNKGPKRPLYSAADRAAVVFAIHCVDFVVIVNDVLQPLDLFRPHIFVKGSEYRGKIQPEHAAFCAEHGIEIRFTDTEVVRPRDRLLKS